MKIVFILYQLNTAKDPPLEEHEHLMIALFAILIVTILLLIRKSKT
jgi:hypothetical protein